MTLQHPSRTVTLTLKVTPAELNSLRDTARADQVSVSELVRSRIFEYSAVPSVKGDKPGYHDGQHPNCAVCAAVHD